MAMVQVGVIALRKPNGDFLPSTPLYKEIPDEQLGSSGMTKTEEQACDELAVLLAKKFKQYKDGLQAAVASLISADKNHRNKAPIIKELAELSEKYRF